jgi:hypothetical protein
VAIKPDLFMDMSEFKNRLQYLYDRVVGSEKMAGVDRVYFPGELEQICAKVSTEGSLGAWYRGWRVDRLSLLISQMREVDGIPWTRAEIDALNAEADLASVPRLITN